MLTRLLIAFALMASCVVLHAWGLTFAIRRIIRLRHAAALRYHRHLRLLVLVASWTVLVHLVEISLWALYYRFGGAMPDIDSALYFSAVTYTTVGYGDLVLPEGWRLVGGVEALTGILMCGWSTAFFFAVVSDLMRQVSHPPGPGPQPDDGPGGRLAEHPRREGGAA